MGNDQSYLYGDPALIKIIEDPDSVRLKMCPPNQRGNPTEFDEIEGSVEAHLSRSEINRLIRDLRKHRDRVFGKDE